MRKAIVRRARGFIPTGLPKGLQILLAAMWVVLAVECVVVVLYPATPTMRWITIGLGVPIVGSALALGAATALVRLARGWRRAAGIIAVVAMSLLPLGVLRAIGGVSWMLAGMAVLATGFLPMLRDATVRAQSRSSMWHLRTSQVAALCGGVPLLAAGVAVGFSRREGALDELLVGVFAVSSAAFVTAGVWGVAMAAIQRHNRASRWFTRRSGGVLLGTLLVAKIVFLVVRATIGRDVFGDALLWDFLTRSPVSWVHAFSLAAVMAVATLRSVRRPLRSTGQTGAITGLVALAVTYNVAPIGDCALSWALLVADPSQVGDVPCELLGTPVFSAVGMVRIAVAIGIGVGAVNRQRTRGWDAGTLLLTVGFVFSLPASIGGYIRNDLDKPISAFWALPSQVDVALTAIVSVFVAAYALRQWRHGALGVASELQRRLLLLLIAPTVTLHAAVLLPAAVDTPVVRRALVVAFVAGAFAATPAIVYGPLRRARWLLSLTAVELVALSGFALLVITNQPDLLRFDEASTELAVFTLAVPLAALLSCRVEASPGRRAGNR